jgi:hypothetical protein
MSWRRQVVAVLFAVTLIAAIGASGARSLDPTVGRSQPADWLDSSAPEELLASRLNITFKAKTPLLE